MFQKIKKSGFLLEKIFCINFIYNKIIIIIIISFDRQLSKPTYYTTILSHMRFCDGMPKWVMRSTLAELIPLMRPYFLKVIPLTHPFFPEVIPLTLLLFLEVLLLTRPFFHRTSVKVQERILRPL